MARVEPLLREKTRALERVEWAINNRFHNIARMRGEAADLTSWSRAGGLSDNPAHVRDIQRLTAALAAEQEAYYSLVREARRLRAEIEQLKTDFMANRQRWNY